MTLDREKVLAELQGVFNDIFLDPVTVTAELSAGDVPEWDSLLQVSLVVAVERHFNIRFRMGEVEATANVGEFAALIARRANDT